MALLVRALETGFFGDQLMSEGDEWIIKTKIGKQSLDKRRHRPTDLVLTPEDQLGSWMEVIKEIDDSPEAPQIVYVDKEASKPKKKKKSSKKEAEPVAEKPSSDDLDIQENTVTGQEELTATINTLVETLGPQTKALESLSFKVEILWKVFTWLCTLIGVSLVGALLTLLIRGA